VGIFTVGLLNIDINCNNQLCSILNVQLFLQPQSICHREKVTNTNHGNRLYIGLHVQCKLFLSSCKQNWNLWINYQQIVVDFPKMIFHDIPSSGSPRVTYGWRNEHEKCNCFFF
jgi:hypothetical protein